MKKGFVREGVPIPFNPARTRRGHFFIACDVRRPKRDHSLLLCAFTVVLCKKVKIAGPASDIDLILFLIRLLSVSRARLLRAPEITEFSLFGRKSLC